MADLLTTWASLQPDKPAVIDDRPGGRLTVWSFDELEARSNRLARLLQRLGAGPGVKVVWCGPNSPGVIQLVNAARKIGATAVPLNYRFTADEAAYVVDHCDATIAWLDAEQVPLFEAIAGATPKLEHRLVFDRGDAPLPDGFVDGDASAAGEAAGPPEVDEAAAAGAATMIYTSGTTGRPKGALRRSGNDPAQTMALVQLIGYRTDDVYLTTGPLYHSGPGGFMQVAQALGQTVVTQRRFDPEDWLRLVHTHRCTSTFSAPTPIRMVCSLPDEVKARYDRSSMRVMIANAAPWSMALKQRYLADFPADSLWEVYGSSELGVNCVLEPADQLRKPGSCGKPAPLVEVRLYDDDGNVVEGTGPDHPGELFVRAASVFSDYYKQHDKYEADHRDGFQTVGDIAWCDDEGYLYICDRKKDMIISGGMNVYPAEIEAVLEQHPAVFDVAVFGVPSEEWGEAVHAVVVARPEGSLSADDVIAFAREHLASYKVPKSVSFLAELPRTGSGKILKRELRAPYWAGYSRQVG